MNAVETRGLSRSFGDRVAVHALDLCVAEGELFALLGQNGAGKTTTVRMLCCLLRPTAGDALLLGDSIVREPEAVKRKISVSPQETAIAPNLTVRENLELIARIYGCTKENAADKAAAMLLRFGLEERADDRAKLLSGGLQRRLSIAMSLISEPQILFLDEPTLGLDVRARRELWRMLLALKGEVTVVLTTHYLEEAAALADHVAILHQGRLQAVGTVEQLKILTGAPSLEDAFLALTEAEVLA